MHLILCTLSVFTVFAYADPRLGLLKHMVGKALQALPKKLPNSTWVPYWQYTDVDQFLCQNEGYFPNVWNCKYYYHCIAYLPGHIVRHIYECNENLVYSDRDQSCIIPSEEERAKCNAKIDMEQDDSSEKTIRLESIEDTDISLLPYIIDTTYDKHQAKTTTNTSDFAEGKPKIDAKNVTFTSIPGEIHYTKDIYFDKGTNYDAITKIIKGPAESEANKITIDIAATVDKSAEREPTAINITDQKLLKPEAKEITIVPGSAETTAVEKNKTASIHISVELDYPKTNTYIDKGSNYETMTKIIKGTAESVANKPVKTVEELMKLNATATATTVQEYVQNYTNLEANKITSIVPSSEVPETIEITETSEDSTDQESIEIPTFPSSAEPETTEITETSEDSTDEESIEIPTFPSFEEPETIETTETAEDSTDQESIEIPTFPSFEVPETIEIPTFPSFEVPDTIEITETAEDSTDEESIETPTFPSLEDPETFEITETAEDSTDEESIEIPTFPSFEEPETFEIMETAEDSTDQQSIEIPTFPSFEVPETIEITDTAEDSTDEESIEIPTFPSFKEPETIEITETAEDSTDQESIEIPTFPSFEVPETIEITETTEDSTNQESIEISTFLSFEQPETIELTETAEDSTDEESIEIPTFPSFEEPETIEVTETAEDSTEPGGIKITDTAIGFTDLELFEIPTFPSFEEPETFGATETAEDSTDQESIKVTTVQSCMTPEEIAITKTGYEQSECVVEAFFGDSENCSKFYRCVRFGVKFMKYEFFCPHGTIWDDHLKTCNYRAAVKKINCKDSNKYPLFPFAEQKAVNRADNLKNRVAFICPTGFRQHPNYCNAFYQCIINENLKYQLTVFLCPIGSIFDQRNIRCSRDQSIRRNSCVNLGIAEKHLSSRILTHSEIKMCPTEGLFQYGGSCTSNYFHCKRDQLGTLEGYLFLCPRGQLFSPTKKKCVSSTLLPLCKNINTLFSSKRYIL